MQRVVRMALLAVLSIVLIACVSIRSSDFSQGISCFKAGDYRKAFIRLKPEAHKGQCDAQYAIGYMYYYGRGVVEDRRKAWYWIRRAAAQGQPEAVEAVKILMTTKTIESV
ncbi:tetratricopeptide repeat protein [Legionella sp. CNM-1927-20]|uniref:tetratricopeptide repeat protein n=1 Tax=Legionella sp. CNM-1927-20 TaxID=3422221 RepID=UPI00403ADB20